MNPKHDTYILKIKNILHSKPLSVIAGLRQERQIYLTFLHKVLDR